MPLDVEVFHLLNNLAAKNPVFDALIIFLADYIKYFLIGIFLLFLFFSARSSAQKIKIFSTAFISMLISRFGAVDLIRFFYPRPRPFIIYQVNQLIPEGINGFPSGHAALFFALAMSVYFYNKKWGVWFFAAAILMGLSRVIAGVHYPADILGGAAVGILMSFLIFLAIDKVLLQKKSL